MLTPDDINAARESMRFNNVPRYNTIYAALAAYSRVAAWVEGGALDAVIRSRHLSPEVREAVKGCRDDVRKALEG